MEHTNAQSVYTFGGLTPEEIYRFICDTLELQDDIDLYTGENTAAIFFGKQVVFKVRSLDKSPCLTSPHPLCAAYVSRIRGACQRGCSFFFPLRTDKDSSNAAIEMLFALYADFLENGEDRVFDAQRPHSRCSSPASIKAVRPSAGKGRSVTPSREEIPEKSFSRYTVFDVEMPNTANDTMCSLGIVRIEKEQIIDRHYFLIDPQVPFDPINMGIHGITPQDVAGKPTFKQLWPVLEPLLSDSLLVAHGAPSDMAVLAKCINANGITWQPCASYVCTCQMGKTCLPHAESYKLNALCRHLGFTLKHHHNAMDDADGCARLFLHYLKLGADPAAFVRNFDIVRARTIHSKSPQRTARLPHRKKTHS